MPTTRSPDCDAGNLCFGFSAVEDGLATATPPAITSPEAKTHHTRFIADLLITRQLGRRRPIRSPVGCKVACTHGDRIPIPQVVDLIDEPGLGHLEAPDPAPIELAERISPILLHRQLRQPLRRIWPR